MGHFIFHALTRVLALQYQPFLEGGIETPVVGVREPDEVGRAVVGVVAVQMMTLMVEATGTDPSDSDKKMTIRIADEAAHPRIVGMDVGFGFEVLDVVAFDLVQPSGREGEEDTHRGTIEFRVPLSWYCAYTKAEFGAVWEIDFLRGQFIFLHSCYDLMLNMLPIKSVTFLS
jgi:hypothetical protein